MWPYPLTGNFVVKSVVDSDIQVNGGTDADPKKQGEPYGLQFGLKIERGPGPPALDPPMKIFNGRISGLQADVIKIWVRVNLVARILSSSFSFVPGDKNVLFIIFRVSKTGFSMFLT